ncbi:hypothetical protein F4Z98_04035 [Candidatus Poribacteria bacterium]|nr:hypothetical protein [Candidatus Poribacteria bacterium]
MLRKRVWIPILCVFVIAMGCGLFYGRKVANQEPVKVYKPASVEQPATPKPPPPGESYETGHWHGDEWHSEPHDTHAPVNPSTPVQDPPSGEAPGAPGAASADAQIIEQAEQEGNIRLFDKRTEEYKKAVKVWQEWHKKFDELNAQFLQVGDEMTDALPETKEEAKRYDNDENYKKEVARKYHEAFARSAKIGAMLEAHEGKKPPFPYIK